LVWPWKYVEKSKPKTTPETVGNPRLKKLPPVRSAVLTVFGYRQKDFFFEFGSKCSKAF
jgi:hypothetical protein